MAEYSVPNGHIGAHEKTLVADTTDTVTFEIGDPQTPGWAQLPKDVEILSDGAAPIWVTVDGTEPQVGSTACHYIPAFATSNIIDVRDTDPQDAVIVKLKSSGNPTYSVASAG